MLLATLACAEEAAPAVIGYAFPAWGAPAVHVAMDEIAAWPPAQRPPVRFEYESLAVGGDTPDVEVLRAQRFVGIPGLVAVVGHGGSRGSLVAAPVYNQAGVVQITPTSTSRLLRQAGPWTFTLAPDDSAEGAFIATFAATQLGARQAAIFYVNDEYGAGLRDGTLAEFRRRGVAVTAVVPFEAGGNFAVLVDAALRRGRPDVIVQAGRQRESGLIARHAVSRIPGLRFVAGDGALMMPLLAEAAGPAADSIYVVAFWLPNPDDSLSVAFVRRFRRVAGREPVAADAMSHDALMLLVHAVHEVGPDAAAIRDFLVSLGTDRPPYPGVTGAITFLPGREARFVMARIRGGRITRADAPGQP